MWRETNKDLLMMVELLSKENTEKEEEHADEMDVVIVETKSGIFVAVWEANLKLA